MMNMDGLVKTPLKADATKVINLSEESEDIRAIKSHFRNVVLKKDK
jgi:hypothetical protein